MSPQTLSFSHLAQPGDSRDCSSGREAGELGSAWRGGCGQEEEEGLRNSSVPARA